MKISDNLLRNRADLWVKRPMPPRDRRYALYLNVAIILLLVCIHFLRGELALPVVFLLTFLLVLNVFNLLLFKRPFMPYDRILSAFSRDGIQWEKEAGVRLDVGGQNSSRQVYSPCVIAIEGGWRMFYRGGGYDSVILSAFSTDGIDWREEPGQRVGLGGSYDFVRVDFPEIVECAAHKWKLFYAATDGNCWRIYCRDSVDMLYWGNEQVVLDMRSNDRYPQAIDPSIIEDCGGWRLFITVFGDAENRFFTAFSPDAIHWQQPQECRGFTPVMNTVRNASVLRLANGQMRLYFSEYKSSIIGSKIASAVSDDGVDWFREEGVRLQPGDEYDLHGVFCPNIVPIPEGWRMYYGGYWGHHWFDWLTRRQHRGT